MRVPFAKLGVAAVLLVSTSAAQAQWSSLLAWFQTQQRELSALAIETKQAALAANQVSEAEVNARKQLSVAMGTIMMSDRVRDVVLSYDANLGQPMLLKCDAQLGRQLAVETHHQANLDSRFFMGSYVNSMTADRLMGEAAILNQRREWFCSVSEAKQGICKLSPNGMQAWDTSYAGAFSEPTMTPDVELAAFAFATNLSDVRPSKGIYCKSADCEAAQLKQMQSTAIGSMIATSVIGQVSERRSTKLEGK